MTIITSLPPVDDMFTYHKPTDTQVGQMQTIRDLAKVMAHTMTVLDVHPEYLKEALQKLHDCTMTLNAGIVLYGK